MKTYYAYKNFKKYLKKDPDYLINSKTPGENTKNRHIGRVYKNRGRNGLQYLKIEFFDEERESEDGF